MFLDTSGLFCFHHADEARSDEAAALFETAENDDRGGGLNARITFRADQAGAYRIQATTFNAGAGPFTLTVREQANPPKEEMK